MSFPANSLTDPSLAVPFEGKGLDPNDRLVNISAYNGDVQCVRLITKTVKSATNDPVEFTGDVSFKGNVDITGSITQPADTLYENARRQNPNEAETYGTSRSVQARGYVGHPFSGGNEFSTGLKIEYDTGLNKATVPGLDVSLTFDLVPNASEAGAMDSEIISAGFVGPFAARANNYSWYGVTCDDQNFYYTVSGSPSFFATLFGFGTNTLLICRRILDAKLIWVRDSAQYSLMLPGSTNLVGSPLHAGRTSLAIHRDRLYMGDALTNLGPQIFCIDKITGAPVWSMLYDVPTVAGGGVRVSPTQPLRSQNGSAFAGSNYALSDLNMVVKELTPGVPSIFAGLSSYQNAINADRVYNTMVDQGAMFRIDDLGTTATLAWKSSTCARRLVVGDTITAGGDPTLDAFRSGATETLIWRDSVTGAFAEGGVIGKVLDNTGAFPGYRPAGYPLTTNNNRMPVQHGRIVTSADMPLTEASFKSVFRTPAPGLGSGARIYQSYQGAPTVAKTITAVLADMNAALPLLTNFSTQGVVVFVYAYLTAAEITAVDGAAAPFLAANVGARYIAALPTPYTITNAQEANALNYYGNSTWGPAPTIDIKRNMIYFGNGQAHGIPVEEILTYQDPDIDFRDRSQAIVDAEYRFLQFDATLAGSGPYSSLQDVNDAKTAFCNTHRTLCLNTALMSPRGQRSYSCAIIGLDLTTGEMQFGVRTMPSDIANFGQNPRILKETFLVGPDADVSSGIQLFEDVTRSDGRIGHYLAANNKGCIVTNIDISGVSRDVPWLHNNAIVKGVVPFYSYTGTLSALGGSNYGSCQSGGKFLLYTSHNFSTDVASFDIPGSGVRSNTYQANPFGGWQFHLTRDGREYKIRDSVLGAYDVSKNEIAWEINIGNCDFSYPVCYNGIVFLCTSQGLLLGYDVKDGHKVWSRDAISLGLGGVVPPVFTQGVGIGVCNYKNGPGRLGNKGVILRVSPSKIIPASATYHQLVGGATFNSYDVIPKLISFPLTLDLLIEPEIISHVWSASGQCLSNHTRVGNPTEQIIVQASNYISAGSIITFDDNGTTIANMRYKYIEMLNATDYILFYQRFEGYKWYDFRATFKKA